MNAATPDQTDQANQDDRANQVAQVNRDALADLPDRLAARPRDPRRGLPIPYMSSGPDENGNETYDFATINAVTVARCAADRLCGICGGTLPYWIAFLGGPKSAAARTYVDPAFCIDCAEWAIRLCPHLALERHKRIPEARLGVEVHEPDGFVSDKPDTFVMGITRDYKIKTAQGHIYLLASPWKRTREFAYENGAITEVTPAAATP